MDASFKFFPIDFSAQLLVPAKELHEFVSALVDATIYMYKQLDADTSYTRKCCNRECEESRVHLVKLLGEDKSYMLSISMSWIGYTNSKS